MAGHQGIEPWRMVLETTVLPTKLMTYFNGADDENRTHLASLEGWNTTNMPHPLYVIHNNT